MIDVHLIDVHIVDWLNDYYQSAAAAQIATLLSGEINYDELEERLF